jgi:hypothetical protein
MVWELAKLKPRYEPIAADFVRAFMILTPVHENHIAILRAHARAPQRRRTATQLAKAIGYRNYNAVNLQYGHLAARVGAVLGLPLANLSLLVEFIEPGQEGNEQWELILRPAVLEAITEMGWL